MPPWHPISDLLFYGLQILKVGPLGALGVLFRIFKVGPSKFFYVKPRPDPPACLLDPTLGEHGYVQLKNLKIHYVANGESDKPLMLLVHGFPEFWYSWRHQLREFAKCYRVVAIDMRGYGDSGSFPDVKDYHLDILADDIRGVIDALGFEQCILVGHDWGGLACWRAATLYPERISKLIMCNSPHALALMEHIMASKSQQKKSRYAFFFQLPCLPEIVAKAEDLSILPISLTSRKSGAKPGAITKEDMEAFKYTFSRTGFRGPMHYYRALVRYATSVPKSGLKIRVPTLIIWGTGDAALEKQMAELSVKKYTEDGKIEYVEGASHWIQQEEPEIVNKHIYDFLDANEIPAETSKL